MSNDQMSGNWNGCEIAVIGMSGRFPGANNIEKFWQNLRDGVESISVFSDEEVLRVMPDPRWLKTSNLVKAGGVLENMEFFDGSFFGYSPREAEIMDPQHRFFIECAWEALENSGYSSDNGQDLIGVFAGVGMSGYLVNIYSNPDVNRSAEAFHITYGNDKDYLATRVCYKLNLKGPGVTVQTSCSTSLVATHLACQSLLSGACEIALAGGVTIGVTQKAGYIYQEQGVLSPDGHTRTFDDRAQGCVSGSGVGVVVLKRLEDALADRDFIHAIIKGSAINNDGSLKVGYTAPGMEGQAAVIRMAQAMADVEPETITYVEAHGTGTQLGDPAEIEGLTQAFRAKTRKLRFCAIGSVKTNIGHLDTAAGVAGLIKTILALKHKQIPPSLHFQQPNRRIDFDNSPFYVNTALTEWQTQGHPLRAGVSSFGIGGTNAHVIVEQAPAPDPSSSSRPWQLLALSAKTESALEAMTSNLTEHLQHHSDLNLADVAYTLHVGRRAFGHRRTIVCRNPDDAVESLKTQNSKRVRTHIKQSRNPHVVFMFPGQGTQYVRMGMELYQAEPTFREQVDLCSESLRQHTGFDIRDVLYPREDLAEATQQLRRTLITQTALFVIEYALAKLWIEWGVYPQAMIGHSLGEYVAACLADVFSLETALMLVAARGRLMEGLPGGGMMVVSLSEQQLRPLVQDKGLSLAAVNAPSRCVISGPNDAVKEFAHYLDQKLIGYKPLQVSHAFHSEMMEPMLKPFLDLMGSVKLNAPRIRYISNVTGTWIGRHEAIDPRYWVEHLRQTVRFSDGLGALLKGQDCILLELGPGSALSTLAMQHPDKPDGQITLASLRDPQRGESEMACLLSSLGQLWLNGANINWSAFYAHERRNRLPLPVYPFERKRYWIERRTQSDEPGAHQPSSRKRPDIADWFYVPVWRQSTSPLLFNRGQMTQKSSRWLLLMDECGVGQQIAERLEHEGLEIITVKQGAEFIKSTDRDYVINPGRSGDYQELIKELRTSGRLPQMIVHLWTLSAHDGLTAMTGESFKKSQEPGFYSLLLLAKSLGEPILASPPERPETEDSFHIAVVSNNMQKVNGNEELSPEKATLLGPVKVIPQEYPNITCRSIDITLAEFEAGQKRDRIDQLLAELKTGSSEPVIAYRGCGRWVQTFEAVRITCPQECPPRLRKRGAYFIVGGLGNIGLEIARYLARAVEARLILIDRSGFPPGQKWEDWPVLHGDRDGVSRKIKRLRELEHLGAEVLILNADAADQDQLQAAVIEAVQKFGEVNGLIYAEEFAFEGLIRQRTQETVTGILASKVLATRLLSAMFETAKLDFFVLCSSLNSLTGGIGAVDDCAANAFFDAFTQAHSLGLNTTMTTIDWDRWPSMEVNHDEARLASDEGELGMSAAEGITAFQSILWSALPQVIVSTRDLQAVLDQKPAVNTPDDSVRHRPQVSTYLRPDLSNPYVAPETETEQVLVDIWQQLLGIQSIGVNDNFFELGGDSVISIQIIAKAGQSGLQLSPKQLFEYPTIAELAKAAGTAPVIIAEQGLVTGPLPLTPIQCWFFESNVADAHHFNQAIILEAREKVDVVLLEKAIHQLLLHHDALRLRFVSDGSGWRQFNADDDHHVEIIEADLSSVPEDRQPEAFVAKAAEIHESLNFTEGPLMRAAFFKMAGRLNPRLLIVIHHLAIDGISWRVLLEDLQNAYLQLSRGQSVTLPAKTTSFKAWSERLKAYAESDSLNREADLWLDEARKQVKSLPVDYSGGANTSASGQTVTVSLNADETRALLQDVPLAYNTQINDSLLAALALAVKLWTGESSLLVDMEGHGREEIVEDVNLSRTVGWFTTIYPVLLSVGDDPAPGEVLKRVKEQLRKIANNGIGYGLLKYVSDNTEIANQLRRMPQAELNFLYLGQLDQVLDETAAFGPMRESSGPSRSPRGLRPYLFEISGMVIGGQLRVTWVYSRELHKRETVEKLAQWFIDSLRGIIAHCQSPLAGGYTPSDFPLAGLDEQRLHALVGSVEFEVE